MYYYGRNMVISYVNGWQQNQRCKKMQENCWQFWPPWGCVGAKWGSLPDEAHQGLQKKPMDATIGRVSAPYCPGCHNSHNFGGKYKTLTKTVSLTELKSRENFWWERVFAYLCICIVFCICIEKTANKMEYRMKIHKVASKQLFFPGSSTLFFCMLVNLCKFPTKSQPKIYLGAQQYGQN